MSGHTPTEPYDDPYEGYYDDFCDCDDYDADILEGRAHCFRCGRSWWLSDAEMSQEIRHFASMIECVEEQEAEAREALSLVRKP